MNLPRWKQTLDAQIYQPGQSWASEKCLFRAGIIFIHLRTTSTSPPAPFSIGMSLPRPITCRALGWWEESEVWILFSPLFHPPICLFPASALRARQQMPAALRAAFPEQGAKPCLSSFATWFAPPTPHPVRHSLTSIERKLRKNLPVCHIGQWRDLLWHWCPHLYCLSKITYTFHVNSTDTITHTQGGEWQGRGVCT